VQPNKRAHFQENWIELTRRLVSFYASGRDARLGSPMLSKIGSSILQHAAKLGRCGRGKSVNSPLHEAMAMGVKLEETLETAMKKIDMRAATTVSQYRPLGSNDRSSSFDRASGGIPHSGTNRTASGDRFGKG